MNVFFQTGTDEEVLDSSKNKLKEPLHS